MAFKKGEKSYCQIHLENPEIMITYICQIWYSNNMGLDLKMGYNYARVTIIIEYSLENNQMCMPLDSFYYTLHQVVY